MSRLLAILIAMGLFMGRNVSIARGTEFDADSCFKDLRRAVGETTSVAGVEYLSGLYAVGRIDEALDAWRALVDATPSVLSRIDHLYWFCLTLLETERSGEAVALLEDARASGLLDSHRSYLHSMTKELLCAAYLELEEFEQAVALAAEIARHGVVPEARILALYDVARAREGLGDTDGAREAWELLTSTAEDTPEAVRARERLGRIQATPRVPIPPGSDMPGNAVCLHLGSSRNHTAATSWAAMARALGIATFIRDDTTPAGRVFTVHTPRLTSFQDGLRARALLTASGHNDVVIVPCEGLE
ncbi:tetratricopeptide repeat protein [Candidatus Fermentibacteria bacterium]|nr:tetratricopeptide repeat protein [Candidatus Fermentibacteria bacterium]